MLSLGYCGLIVSSFCFGISLAVSDEMREMAKMLHDSCVEETGVDEGLITEANSGTFADDNKLKVFNGHIGNIKQLLAIRQPDLLRCSLEILQCYMKCLMEQLSAITDDGEIDGEVLISVLPEEMVDAVAPVIRSCGTVKGVDACDMAFQTQKCYYSKSPDAYFLL